MSKKLFVMMQLILYVFVLIISTTAYAAEVSTNYQPATNVQVLSTQTIKPLTATNDDPFKRLFTTPRQRKILDDWRARGGLKQSQVSGTDESQTNTAAEPIIDPGQPIKLSGILLRADGKNAVWLNGALEKPTEENTAHTIRGNGLQSATVKVPLRNGESGAILKPGQVWVPDGQKVEESYQRPQPKPAIEVPSTDEPNTNSAAAPVSNNAPSSSANTSEMPSNAEPKANAKTK